MSGKKRMTVKKAIVQAYRELHESMEKDFIHKHTLIDRARHIYFGATKKRREDDTYRHAIHQCDYESKRETDSLGRPYECKSYKIILPD